MYLSYMYILSVNACPLYTAQELQKTVTVNLKVNSYYHAMQIHTYGAVLSAFVRQGDSPLHSVFHCYRYN